ncbi:MAG: Crp/Fnr family transcriptional regulator [Ethanoligenens sp.]
MMQKEWTTCFPFLNQMSDDERRRFLQSAVPHQLYAGEVVVREHSKCVGVVFVLSGELKVYKVSESGREVALYSVLPGEAALLTVNCMVAQETPVADVSLAAMQESLIAIIPSSAFFYLYSVSPQLQQFIFSCMYKKFNAIIDLVEKMTFKNVSERLYEYIRENTGSGRIPLYTTHAQLAARLGTSREVVTRCLKKMQRAGLLQTERGKISLLEKPEP